MKLQISKDVDLRGETISIVLFNLIGNTSASFVCGFFDVKIFGLLAINLEPLLSLLLLGLREGISSSGFFLSAIPHKYDGRFGQIGAKIGYYKIVDKTTR